ncbi:MAG TPA: 3-carboxy-cis,cis-muconate cycloisomerase [Candidatus Dormibacteraeota bacterium]|nr:3-carboxy-cis,cis-muconate cycloisomerase [Candidatus Dormibacteraeota bacterium]
MPSDRLFGPTLTIPAMAEAVSDESWLRAMLDVEAAIAAAEAAAGVIPPAAADAIRAACAEVRIDLGRLGEDAAASATPVVPLARALTAAVAGDAANYVHWGATSQDVIDTAMMLVARRGLDVLLAEMDGLADACAALAERHRTTLMPGRTLLQQALPITFGLKAAGWLVAAMEAAEVVRAVRLRRLAVQFGGASGTLASLGDHGLDVLARLAAELDLAEPLVPWHATRGRVVELALALAASGGAAAKVALDVALLMQTEVGEVAEGAPGGSSALPQKRNPVGAVEVDACFRGLQAQVAVLVASQRVEHERAAGAWQAEWPALSEALRLAGGACGRARVVVEQLRVDSARMRANLDMSGGLMLAEHVAMVLASRVGRSAAQRVVQAAAGRASGGGRPFREELLADPEVTAHLTTAELDAALEPGGYLGSTPALIERALAAHRKRTRSRST